MIELQSKETIDELAEILSVPKGLILQSILMLETGKAYRTWTIPKIPTGTRQIHQALNPLSRIQAKIAAEVYPFSVSEISHGFISGRSPRTATMPHINAMAFFTFDIRNAFPSTKKQQVQFNFQKAGFSGGLAALMAKLVCYSHPENPDEGHIPLGYTSSPIIFNLLLRDIDRLLLAFAIKRGYTVTRYVDNFALSTSSGTIPESERKLAVKTVEGLSSGQFSIPPKKREYFEAKKEVHFEFLGLAIKGPKNGQRTIQVADEKLGECLFTILKALEEKDFSESTSRHIQGQMNYLKSIYKDEPLPLRIRELHEQYKFLKQLADTAKKGQLLLPMPPFQT